MKKCRALCGKFLRRLRNGICAHKKCKAVAKCRNWCAKNKLEEFEDFEDIEIQLDQDFDIELIDFEDSEYEDLDMHMLSMC